MGERGEKASEHSAMFSKMEGGYFQRTPDGVQFLDMLYGVPLEPNLPPPSVAEHPSLGSGLAFLSEWSTRAFVGAADAWLSW